MLPRALVRRLRHIRHGSTSRRATSIDSEMHPRDVGRAIRTQEQYDIRDLFRR